MLSAILPECETRRLIVLLVLRVVGGGRVACVRAAGGPGGERYSQERYSQKRLFSLFRDGESSGVKARH
jgi:hypothetical protein